jgi:hypothetical protein
LELETPNPSIERTLGITGTSRMTLTTSDWIGISGAAATIISVLIAWALPKNKEPTQEKEKPFEYKMNEETVTYIEKMTSLPFDVVKINAHSHTLGVAAEYAWIEHKYPNSKSIMQGLTTLNILTRKGECKTGKAHFDVVKIRLPDGREKEIYFDISSFFDGIASSLTNPDEFVSQKLAALYQ